MYELRCWPWELDWTEQDQERWYIHCKDSSYSKTNIIAQKELLEDSDEVESVSGSCIKDS